MRPLEIEEAAPARADGGPFKLDRLPGAIENSNTAYLGRDQRNAESWLLRDFLDEALALVESYATSARAAIWRESDALAVSHVGQARLAMIEACRAARRLRELAEAGRGGAS
jgi:hypothetical protein